MHIPVLTFVHGLACIGLPVFGRRTDAFVYKLAYSYIPYAIAAGLEPLLVSVGSVQCMLWPYKMLASAGASGVYAALALDLDQAPPHFQLARSLWAGQPLVSGLSAAILVVNVLAISLTSLFAPFTHNVRVASRMARPPLPLYDSTYTFTHEQFLIMLLANSTRSQTWVTEDTHRYVYPFSPADGREDFISYEGQGQSIGVDVTCPERGSGGIHGLQRDRIGLAPLQILQI